MINWLDEFHDGQKIVSCAVLNLVDISSALETVGNYALAEKLGDISMDLEDAHSMMGKAISRMLNEDVARGRRAIGQTLMGVLESCEKNAEVDGE